MNSSELLTLFTALKLMINILMIDKPYSDMKKLNYTFTFHKYIVGTS